MDKIFYIDSSLLGKCKRSKWGRYTIVMIEEKLTFGKVKVSTWGFDIPFAYSPVNHIGYDIVDENDIKELNWYNILNDFQKAYHDRKYIIEIKTETSMKFNKRFEPDPKHLLQAACYSICLGVDEVIFLYEFLGKYFPVPAPCCLMTSII